ncbi:MAG TPA: radical SAM protein [Dissulfurispiraceae bacterium]|nr:radical SAM protein [Dissulfurispiraceae bacterium]
MPYLAARVPSGWQVIHIDEEVSEIVWDMDVDVVGMTFHTPSAYHAYDIAKRFRSRGICVALGGPHVTLLPDEARQHADVIFIGEAEGLWEDFLTGYESGIYHSVYEQAKVPTLENIPQARKELFHRHDYTGGALFATRGCPYRCDFCTIVLMYRHGLRKRPIEEVAAELASFKGKVIIFWDDNIAGDIEYAKELFNYIAPYRKWWSSQASIQAGLDDEFLKAASRSGCKQLFLGLESISQQSMTEIHKRFNRVEDYGYVIKNIHNHGIAVQVGIVFGFDNDPPDIFKSTIDFLEDAGVQNATFNILTPFPGTALFAKLEQEARILTYDWSRYNSRTDVVYQPRQMSVEQLFNGFRQSNERFYSLPSITKRLSRSPIQLWWTLPLNLAYSYKWWEVTHSNLKETEAGSKNFGLTYGDDGKVIR